MQRRCVAGFSRYFNAFNRSNSSILCLNQRSLSTKAATTLKTHDDKQQTVKAFDEMPHPPYWPIFLGLPHAIKHKAGTQFHKYLTMNRKELGKIYRSDSPSFTIVTVFDPADVEKFYRMDGKWPKRFNVESWKDYRKVRGIASGMITSEDEEWSRTRKAVDKLMMRPKEIFKYTPQLNAVADDAIQHLVKSVPTGPPNTLSDILFHWALESAGTVLFEKRMDCLSEKKDPEIEEFIQAVHDFLLHTQNLFFVPLKLAKFLRLRIYKEFIQANDTMFRVGRKYVDMKLKEINQNIEKGVAVEGFLSQLLQQKQLTLEEVYSNVIELMSGAVDTTSNTILWCLYELARNPQVQQRLQKELDAVIGPGKTEVKEEDLPKLPYVKACIKEIMRLYPVPFALSRVLDEEIILQGYRIPPGTTLMAPLYCLGRDPEIFEESESYKPDRWLRENPRNFPAFAAIPFGFGPRSCVGRRLAELEMHLLLAKLLKQYQLRLKYPDRPVEIETKLFLLPKTPIEVVFTKR